MDTSRAIERFLESPALSESTRRAYRRDLREFAGWLEARRVRLDAVTPRVFAEYASALGADRPGRDPRKLAPTTLARKLAAVRSFLRASLFTSVLAFGVSAMAMGLGFVQVLGGLALAKVGRTIDA